MSENKVVKGYKVFNPDWTCRGIQYEVGKIYEGLIDCDFYLKLQDCYNNYFFNKEYKVAEVIAYEEIVFENLLFAQKRKYAKKIKVERELTWEEVLNLVNMGGNCTGFGNTGQNNSGNHNTGICNKGNRNTGDYNTGDNNVGCRNIGDGNTGCYNIGWKNTGAWNAGDFNTGNYNLESSNSGNNNSGGVNSGDFNTGWCNTGNHNQGWHNTGDYNCTNHSAGCFNTIPQKMYFFNQLSNWSRMDWDKSLAKTILNKITGSPVKQIFQKNMSKKEKKEHPEYKTIGFYFKKISWEQLGNENQKRWNELSQEEKEVVMAMPNFDKAIFKKITGIDVDK